MDFLYSTFYKFVLNYIWPSYYIFSISFSWMGRECLYSLDDTQTPTHTYIYDSLSNRKLDAFQWFCHSIKKFVCEWFFCIYNKIYSWKPLNFVYDHKEEILNIHIDCHKNIKGVNLSLQSFLLPSLIWYIPIKRI